jgi:TM2 domain-containing membrane protein YozV
MNRGVSISIVLLTACLSLFAQERADTVGVTGNPVEVFEFEVPAESPDKSNIKSPALALTLSALLPGAGQIYNGSYWKTPVIIGFAGYFTYAIIVLHDYYLDYRQRYRESITDANSTGDPDLRFIRDFYRDQRDRFGWYMGFLYLINLLDAYVEATLSSFDVGESLSMRILPFVELHGGGGVQLRIHF